MDLDIGPFRIAMPENHGLPVIFESNVTYDFMPWKIIRNILVGNRLLDTPLVDVGGNIGDTVAHFRTFSAADVLSIEPDRNFYAFLQRNAAQFEGVATMNKLVCPSRLIGKVAFESGSQTGMTSLSVSPDNAWTGGIITLEEIFGAFDKEFLFKSDTDGFDAEIVSDLIRVLRSRTGHPPIIFFEAANAAQIQSGEYLAFVDATTQLQTIGYEILILTNYGFPYAYAGKDHDSVRSAFEGLAFGYRYGRAACHYFDIVAVRADLDAAPIRSGFSFP